MLNKISHLYMSGKKILSPEILGKKILTQAKTPLPPPFKSQMVEPARENRGSVNRLLLPRDVREAKRLHCTCGVAVERKQYFVLSNVHCSWFAVAMEPPSPIQALGVNPFPSRFIIRTVPRGDFARRRWEAPITTTKWHCYCTSSNSRKFGVDRPYTIIS